MDKMKEIQLINKLPTSEEVAEIELALEDGDSVLIIPPKRKTVKLSELPDGTFGSYEEKWCPVSGIHSVSESPKQLWEGGECPVPDGVVVRTCLRNGSISDTDIPSALCWKHTYSDVDIIWYQILRLADGWELVR